MTAVRPDLAILHAGQLVSVHDGGGPRRGPGQGALDATADGAVAVAGGRIAAVGTTAEVRRAVELTGVPTIDASGMVVMPGLVDPHTHPLFAGLRHDEYARRLAGASLAEVAAAGGGMNRTVRETRAASDDDLLAVTLRVYARLLAQGTTAAEVKSGYGLSTEEELRLLGVLDRAARQTELDTVPTFLGAHFVPEEYRGREDAYIDLVVEEMLPAVALQGVARFCDATCEAGIFTPDQARRVLLAGRQHGLPSRVHADAWQPSGGWRLAAGVGAVCADHLTFTPDEEIREVGATDTIAVLLPAAEMIYLSSCRANARLLIETGVPLAIATDFCSSIHVSSQLLMIGLAAAWFRITPAEAVVAATLNAAYAIGRGAELGSLDPGKQADIMVAGVPDVNMLAFGFGTDWLQVLVKRGRVVVDRRREP